jgi:hypothetical protein
VIEREYRAAHSQMFAGRIAWSRRAASVLARPRLLDAMLATVRSETLAPFLLARTRADRDLVARLTDAWVSC